MTYPHFFFGARFSLSCFCCFVLQVPAKPKKTRSSNFKVESLLCFCAGLGKYEAAPVAATRTCAWSCGANMHVNHLDENSLSTQICVKFVNLVQLRTHECAVAARQFKPFPHHGALKRNSGNHFGWGNHSQFSRRCCKWHDWPPEGKYGSGPFDSFRWSCVS